MNRGLTVSDPGARGQCGPYSRAGWLLGLVAAGLCLAGIWAPVGVADVEWDKKMAFLIQVTARPGYNFPNSEAALAYGEALCEKIASGRPYPVMIGEVQNDFNTTDDYQASYLIDRAANELCPEQIWQLRRSAAHYRPAPAGP
ncbi:membrane protein [Mycolicibacter terrae]|jgi:hypothetical protein|uniref:Membrane protein n=1 Tax=Mycolicibacter terrae TaxID=1788 RepID=A0AAD1I1T4_9MYCO|nr:membrane protein [Mycolicibacter terrae]SNV76788.1 Protein of uncharacterised function (DUF732) [Mycolicibacter terrae]